MPKHGLAPEGIIDWYPIMVLINGRPGKNPGAWLAPFSSPPLPRPSRSDLCGGSQGGALILLSFPSPFGRFPGAVLLPDIGCIFGTLAIMTRSARPFLAPPKVAQSGVNPLLRTPPRLGGPSTPPKTTHWIQSTPNLGGYSWYARPKPRDRYQGMGCQEIVNPRAFKELQPVSEIKVGAWQPGCQNNASGIHQPAAWLLRRHYPRRACVFFSNPSSFG